MNHNYFGDLDNNKADEFGVVWEKEINGISYALWNESKEGLKEDKLDNLAKFITEFPNNLEQYKQFLVDYLKEDDEYITFHKEELPSGDKLPSDPKDFVNAMEIESINLWYDDQLITIDFMINKEESDEILSLRLNDLGEFEDIAWES